MDRRGAAPRARAHRWLRSTAVAVAALAGLAGPAAADQPPPEPAAEEDSLAASPSAEDEAAAERAVAFGLLLDAPVTEAALDEALRLAEALRQRYGIDTGDRRADRQAAAERAWREVVEPLRFTPEALEAAARDMGYSLDPAACEPACDNVRRLAEVELRKRALRAFADGGPSPPPPEERAPP